MATETKDTTNFDSCARGSESLTRAFAFLGKRWNGQIIGHLSGGPIGFSELSKAIGGISDSVLSERLSEMAKAGLVTRTVDEGPPLSVTYALTERSEALLPALEQVVLWAEEHLPPAE